MRKHKFRKRNKLDIILTDSRPVELSKIFTLAYFYEYLNKNKEMMDAFERIKRELRPNEREASIWGSRWHAAPLKYHIYKNKYEVREMSLVSPLSMIEMSLFVEGYEKELLLLSSDDGFSVRKHFQNDNLIYLNIKDGKGVTYQHQEEKGMEASGDYFLIHPYKYISEFHNSDEWYKYNREYRCFGKIDYSKCFDSVYTHTFTWLVTKNSVDGKEYGKNQYFLNACDKILQNINGSVTNGIVVGPEFSRTIVEILTQHIDKVVKYRLAAEEIIEKKDYKICRYVDDIFIFADEEKIVEKIIELYRDEAEVFHFRLNDQKRIIGRLPYVWFEWKEKVQKVNEYIYDTIFNCDENSPYIIQYRPKRLSNMKMMYQDLMAQFPDYQAKIASYVLTTIYKNIKKEGDKKYFKQEKLIGMLHYFLDAVFYFYSFSTSYNNTEKVITILDRISNEIPEAIYKDCLYKVFEEYSTIITKSNIEDITNLILFLNLYKLELPYVSEDFLTNRILDGSDPILHAMLLLYARNNTSLYKRIKGNIENKITEAISSIYSLDNFFMYEETWWIYIFCNCSYLGKKSRNMIDEKLEEVHQHLEKEKSDHLAKTAKALVIDFLRDKQYHNKFINWELGKEELSVLTTFTTYQRTLFNGYNNCDYIKENFELY